LYILLCIHYVGRKACIEGLNLAKVGVKIDPASGKIIVDEGDATSLKNVFAIGDVASVRVIVIMVNGLLADSKRLI